MSRRACRHACAFAALLAPVTVPAADWSMQSSAQLYAVAESNPQLLTDGERSEQAGVAALSFALVRRTELLDLNLDARGSLRRYGEDSDLNRDDQQATLSLARRGERYIVNASAALTRDTTLTSELGTTGITQFNQQHRSRSLSLAPQLQLTERLVAGVSVGWQDSSYGSDPQSGLSNYSYRSTGFNASYDLNETTSASLVISDGQLDSALNNFNTHSIAARLQLQHSWSPLWQGSVSGGPSRVRTSQRSANGSVFTAAVSRKGERFTINTSLARSIEPTGSGLLSRRDEFGVQTTTALSSQLDLAIGMNSVRSRELVPQYRFTVSDVRYTRAELSLSWRMASDWSLGFATGNSRQKSQRDSSVGKGFDARLSLAWQRQDLG